MDNQEKSKKEIYDLEVKTCKWVNNGEVEKALDAMSESVMFFNPGSEILKGKSSEREALQSAVNTKGLELSWKPTNIKVSKSDDMAYVHGIIKTKFNGVETIEKYIKLLEKIQETKNERK